MGPLRWAGHRAHRRGSPWPSPPVPQFHPRSAPLRGQTRVTLCGMTFHSPPDPTAHHSLPGPYRVAVGGRSCTVLLDESESYRCSAGGHSGDVLPVPPLSPVTLQAAAHVPSQGLCGRAGVCAGAGGAGGGGRAGRCGAQCDGICWDLEVPCPGILHPQWLRLCGNVPTLAATPDPGCLGLGWVLGTVLAHRPPCHPCLCPGTPHQHPASQLRSPGRWHPYVPLWHPPLSREQLAGDDQWIRVSPGWAAQVRSSHHRSTAGSAGTGTGIGMPLRSHCPFQLLCYVPSEGDGEIRCTAPAATSLGAAPVALWIDGEEFLAPLPFEYRPDPSVLTVVPNCSYG